MTGCNPYSTSFRSKERNKRTKLPSHVLSLVLIPALCAVTLVSPLEGQKADAATTVRDSAGIEIVSNPGTDIPLQWTTQQVMRMGDALGPPETSFFKLNPYSVVGGPDSTILVLNRGTYRIVVFARDGKVLDSFGRQGGGPGEMQNPVSIWVDPGNRIRVLDWMGGILNYDLDGTLISEDPHEATAVGMHMEETPAGLVHTFSVGLRSDTILIEQIRIAQGADTIVLAEWEKVPTTTIVHPTCALRVGYGPIFEPEMVWDTNGRDVAVLAGYSYRLDLYGPDGKLVRSIRRAVDLIQATSDDARQELGPVPGFRIRGRLCTWDPKELVELRGFYPLIQPLDAMALTPDGYLWARRTNPGDDPGSIDVFRPDGTYAGSLPGSTPFPDAFLDSTHFLTIETDEFDVEYVVVYEISTR